MRAILLGLICWLAAAASLPAAEDRIASGQLIGGGGDSSRAAAGDASEPSEELGSQLFASEGSSLVGIGLNVAGFVLILGGFAVAGWYLFRKGFLRKPGGMSEGKLKVVENRMLGNRQYLMVVEYEESKILLGVGPGKIDYLTTLGSLKGNFPPIEPQAVEKSVLQAAGQYE